MTYKIEKAKIEDAPAIQEMVNSFAETGEMLGRPLSEIYENLRDFYVARQGGSVIACAALHIAWSDMAEVKSLAVCEKHQRKRIGKSLVEICLNEAKELGIHNTFVLTYVTSFFQKCGFMEADKAVLPHKIWGECYRCPKFPNCDEVAMVYRVK
ncbi:MAG: N-acetyltransferase [Dehalococcoidia bacterium]|nr:N-acetyltransferase [Dehalococcoidia bacterium]